MALLVTQVILLSALVRYINHDLQGTVTAHISEQAVIVKFVQWRLQTPWSSTPLFHEPGDYLVLGNLSFRKFKIIHFLL